MTSPQPNNFIKEVEKHADNMARFYRVDLHVHSPESHDFPHLDRRPGYATTIPPDDQLPDLDERKEAYKKSLRKAPGVDVVAITDHNKSQFATTLTREVTTPIIFPGIEVAVKTTPEFTDHKVHLLCIFPQGTPDTDIESIFPTSHRLPPIEERDKNTVYEGNVHDLIKNVHNLKGIVVAAHVNSGSGLRKVFLEYETERLSIIREIRRLENISKLSVDEKKKLAELKQAHDKVDNDIQKRYLQFLDNHSIDAVQISRPGEEQFYGQHHVALLGLNPFPCLLCSDAHNSADVGIVGGRTFIKLQKPSIEGLQSAFKDPGARIRYDTDEILSKTARIEGIAVEGGFLDGLSASFSENLSCLIGGRGSGKSAIIESIRFALGANVPTDVSESIKKMHDFVLKDSAIKLLFRTKDGERFILKCSRASNGDPVFECWDTSGNLCTEVKQWSERLHVDLYGWSEIEKLSYDMASQRELIDSAIPEAEELQKEIDTTLADLEVNRTGIVTKVKDYNSLVPKARSLEEARELKKRILAELQPQLKKDQERLISRVEKEVDNMNDKIDDLNDVIEGYQTALDSIMEVELYPIPKTVLSKLPVKTKKKVLDALAGSRTSVKEAKGHIKKILSGLEKERDSLTSKVQKKEEKLAELENDPNYQECVDLLKSKSNVEAEIRKYRPAEQKMRKEKKALSDALAKRKKLEKSLTLKQAALYKKREAVVTKINSDLKKVNEKLKEHNVRLEVDVEALTDKTNLVKYLTAEMKNVGSQYIAKQHPQSLVDNFSHSELTKVLWSRDIKSIASKTSLNEEQSGRVVEHFQIEQEDGTWSETNVGRVLKIGEEVHNDKPSIKYNGKSLVEGLSPGQRCTALLPLVFLRTNLTPLIIDQPEDNLDSQLVFELVVDMLRGLKERRQVIIATHNPNIPVSGDAEQVIVLAAESDKKTSVAHQGSIDDSVVTERIKALLEGGEEAFKIRSRKYGLLK